MRHWLAHRLGWNEGRSIVAIIEGEFMIAFICDKCGAWSGIHWRPIDKLVRF